MKFDRGFLIIKKNPIIITLNIIDGNYLDIYTLGNDRF